MWSPEHIVRSTRITIDRNMFLIFFKCPFCETNINSSNNAYKSIKWTATTTSRISPGAVWEHDALAQTPLVWPLVSVPMERSIFPNYLYRGALQCRATAFTYLTSAWRRASWGGFYLTKLIRKTSSLWRYPLNPRKERLSTKKKKVQCKGWVWSFFQGVTPNGLNNRMSFPMRLEVGSRYQQGWFLHLGQQTSHLLATPSCAPLKYFCVPLPILRKTSVKLD